MENKAIEGTALEALRAELRGGAYVPGDDGYDGATRAWNLNARQRPALVVVAEEVADILAAVRFARDAGLGVGTMATGHGVASPCDTEGVLINTSRMRGVGVDPEARTARVEAGAKWADVLPEAQAHGLAGLVGSSSNLGVVGYTLGGGFGWLGRKYGFAADSTKEAEVVTADGELVTANPRENADLFWGLKGGGGNFGVVTSLQFALYPIPVVYGGNLFYPVEQAAEVLELYGGWSATLPDEMTTAVAFLNLPPIPQLPEPLRGGSFVSVRACYCGEEPEERGEELIKPWREALGEPVLDTFGAMPPAVMEAISMDPVEPMGAYGHSEMLRGLSPEAIETLVEVTGPGSPLVLLELRQLGGALSRPPASPSPVGRGGSPFILNGIGATFSPEMARAVQAYLAYLAEAISPHKSGTNLVNFLELDGASPARVEAAYSPEDWERLTTLKSRHDPNNLFRFNRNVPPSGVAPG